MRRVIIILAGCTLVLAACGSSSEDTPSRTTNDGVTLQAKLLCWPVGRN